MNLKRLAKRALATLSLSMLCLIAFAQGHQISGTVIDGTGEPIIGANVLEVGTTNGVITDIDGNFKLSVQPNAKIQVSFIGYITQTVTVGSQKNIKVTLKEDAQALDEVVVVGYGTMKKTDVTGSLASVSADKLAARGALRVEDALQGSLRSGWYGSLFYRLSELRRYRTYRCAERCFFHSHLRFACIRRSDFDYH